MIERDVPLAQLKQWLADLHRPGASGGCVLLHGEAGVGKTSLLRALRDVAPGAPQPRHTPAMAPQPRHTSAMAPQARQAPSQPAPADWLWGLCEPLLSPTPLGPLLDMQDGLPPTLAAMLRSGRAAQQVMPELLDWLKRLTRPLVLVIDDVQWADHASLDLLRFLGRRLEGLRVLLVLSYRDDELPPEHPLLSVIAGLPQAATLRLGLQPLSPAAVAQVAFAAGRPAQGLHALTQGNPFFLTELLATPQAGPPASVRDAVVARAQRLSPAARRLLDLLSVSPSPLPPAELGAMLDDAPALVDEALAQTLATGLLVALPQGVAFRHEIARRAIESALSPPRLQGLHRRILQALPQASATRRVHHADGAGLVEEVLHLAPLAAAHAAQASAHRQAAALLGLALQRCAADTPWGLRVTLRLAHAEQCELIGALATAHADIEAALALQRQHGHSAGQGHALVRLARVHWLLGEIATGKRLAAEAIALLGPPAPPAALAMAYAVMAQLHLLDDSDAAAAHWGQKALALAEAAGDIETQVHALNTLGAAGMANTDQAHAQAQLQRSLAMALAQGWADHAARAYCNLVVHALVQRRVGDWSSLCDQALAYCQARDLDMYVHRLRVRQAHGWMQTGQWDAAERALGEVARDPEAALLDRQQATHLLALLELRRGAAAGRTSGASRTSHTTRATHAYWREQLDGQGHLHPAPWFAPPALVNIEAAWLLGQRQAMLRVLTESWPVLLASAEPWRCGQLAVWRHRLGGPQPSAAFRLAAPCEAELAGELQGAAAAWQAVDNPYEAALCALRGGEQPLRRPG